MRIPSRTLGAHHTTENELVTPKADPAMIPLEQLLARVKFRRWLRQCGSAAQRLVPAQVVAVGVWFAAEWLAVSRWVSAPWSRWVALGAITLLPGAVAAIRQFWRYCPPFTLSLSVDRYLGSGDLLTSALCFAKRAQPTPLETLVVRQAAARCRGVDARQVVPLGHVPALWLLLLGTLLLGALVPRRPVAPSQLPWWRRSVADPGAVGTLNPHELEHIRAVLTDLEQSVNTSEGKAEVGRLQQLMAAHALGQSELQAFERNLLASSLGSNALAQEISLEFSGVAGALARQRSTQPLAQALNHGRYADAVLALEALQRRWREPRTKPSAEELMALRKAVQAERTERQRRQDSRRDEAASTATQSEELRRHSNPEDPALHQQRLEALSRRLEQLERRKQAADRADPAIAALERAISQAASALANELEPRRSEAFGGFDEAQQELERLRQTLQTETDRREILERIQQLRERLRSGGRVESPRAVAWFGFDRRANGSRSSAGPRADAGVPLTAGSSDAGAPLIAEPNPSGSALLMGVAELPPERGAAAASPRDGGDRTEPSSRQSGGPPAGDRHDPVLRGATPGLGIRPTKAATAVTSDTGAGAVSPEVVAVAAQRGFVGQDYREVFRAYAPIAESLLDQADVPSAQKAQVRRYFQLIRPREDHP